jgi:hypothetical protein
MGCQPGAARTRGTRQVLLARRHSVNCRRSARARLVAAVIRGVSRLLGISEAGMSQIHTPALLRLRGRFAKPVEQNQPESAENATDQEGSC